MLATVLTGFLIGAPLVGGVFLCIGARQIPAGRVNRWLLIAVGGTLLSALALLLLPPVYTGETIFRVPWLPGVGDLGLYLTRNGFMLTAIMTGCLFLAAHPALQRKAPDLPPFSAALLLLMLSAANIAFLSKNFLGRYVALEVVGLGIALAPLLEVREGARLARWVYLLLRLGDVGLLLAILVLHRAAGTLDINAALSASLTLPPALLAWIVGGFVLAVWVKVGAWPLHFWREAAVVLGPASRAWSYAAVMPTLGLYLLYRITPLLPVVAPLRTWLFWLGAGALLAAALRLIQRRAEWVSPSVLLGAVIGGLALCLAADGFQSAVWWLTLLNAPLHLAGEFIWTSRAAALPTWPDFLENGLQRLSSRLESTVETGGLEKVVMAAPRLILTSAQWIHHTVEEGGLERLIAAGAHGVIRLGLWLQQQHTGRLRTNLGWAMLSLVIAILLLVRGK